MMRNHYGIGTTMRIAGMGLALVLSAIPLHAQGAGKVASSDPKAVALVRSFEDKLNLVGLDVTNTFTLVQKKTGEADRVIQIRIYRRDATDTFTLVFQYPDSEKGKGY